MAKTTTAENTEIIVQPERTNFLHMLALNANYFGNIAESKLNPVFKLSGDTTYEQVSCIGYNPDTENMEAVVSINKSGGYSGDLCSAGSFEYVRFYMDFHDGKGFIDQGSVAFNVHDIPAGKDCTGASDFPLKYVATLKKSTPWFSLCTKPELPTMRAILSWNYNPPANSPNWKPVWGNVVDGDVQLRPAFIFDPAHLSSIEVSNFIKQASLSPHLSVGELQNITGVDISKLHPAPETVSFEEIAKSYLAAKVSPTRFSMNTVHEMMKNPSSAQSLANKATLENLKIDIASIIKEIGVVVAAANANANIDFEQLTCVGLDYNSESLVATIKIKKNLGYSGNLCSAGSKEYVAFWIDWDNSCQWHYLNTVQLNVHDVNMPGDALYYSVTLPLDASMHRKLCKTPNIIRVRGVLSWETPPSTTDPNKLEFYGNRIDAHIQIKPGTAVDPTKPLYTIIGGIDVAHVDDGSGLTKPGSFFAYNGLPVPTGAPFGGEIVINGPLSTGKYRFKITDLNTGNWRYATDKFTVVGFLPVAPFVQYTTVVPDPATGFMDFLPYEKNILSVLTRFTPGTDDKFRVDMELQVSPGVFFTKYIQMDNTAPTITLTVNDGGDCTHFAKGDTITGSYSVYDAYIDNWSFGSTWVGGASGTANTPGVVNFSIPTTPTAYPCGGVSLGAWDKAIINSQSVGHYTPASYAICLQTPKK